MILDPVSRCVPTRKCSVTRPTSVGFQKMENVYFIGSRVTSFDTSTGQGTLQWDRYWRNTTLSFNKIDGTHSWSRD